MPEPDKCGVTCDAGSGLASGSCECEPCAPGKASKGGVDSVCAPCPAGKFAPGMGNPFCLSCDDGHEPPTVDGQHSRVSTKAECVPCVPGEVAQDGAVCAACTRGTWMPAAGGAVCGSCPPGQAMDLQWGGWGSYTYNYASNYGAKDGEPGISEDDFALYTYNGVEVHPTDIAKGFARAKWQAMLAAQKRNGDERDAVFPSRGFVPAPDWSPTVNSSASCEVCPLGTTPTASGKGPASTTDAYAGRAACLSCADVGGLAWRHDESMAACQSCPVGTYMPVNSYQGAEVDGSADCSTDCSLDFTEGAAMSVLYGTCIELAPSLSSDGSLATCEIGSVPSDGGCTPCPAEEYAAAGDGKCMPCREGYTTNGLTGQGGCTLAAQPIAEDSCGHDGDVAKSATPALGDYTCAVRVLMSGSNDEDDAKAYDGSIHNCSSLKSVFEAGYSRMGAKLCAKSMAEEGEDVFWGSDDSAGLAWVTEVMPLNNFVWATIILAMGHQHLSLQDVIDSQNGFLHVAEASAAAQEANELRMTCDDERNVDNKFCAFPFFAIFCPQTCGSVVDPDILCGKPTINYQGRNYLGSFDLSRPAFPPSMAECTDKSGKVDDKTGQIVPVCLDK